MDETYPSGNLIKFIPLIEEVFILKVTYVGKKIQKLGKVSFWNMVMIWK